MLTLQAPVRSQWPRKRTGNYTQEKNKPPTYQELIQTKHAGSTPYCPFLPHRKITKYYGSVAIDLRYIHAFRFSFLFYLFFFKEIKTELKILKWLLTISLRGSFPVKGITTMGNSGTDWHKGTLKFFRILSPFYKKGKEIWHGYRAHDHSSSSLDKGKRLKFNLTV